MTAPLSLRDKQVQYLVGIYGPGLSYADMLSKYRGGGKSLSDLEYAAYLGNPASSLSDNMDTAIPGSGSLSDQMYADSSGGITTTITNLAVDPKPGLNASGWQSTSVNWVHTYSNNEISVDRQAGAAVDIAASIRCTGLGAPTNPALKLGVNYQRSVEIWVDAAATVTSLTAGGYVAGQAIPANTWTKVVQQFTGTGVAQYVTGFQITMVGVSTGIHVKFRKGFLAENPTGRELAYADGNSPGWKWDGTANASTSTGPAIFQSDLISVLTRNPKPISIAGWTYAGGAGNWVVTYANNEISADRQAAAPADIAVSMAVCGNLPFSNPTLSASKTYQRSVEVWVDAQATVVTLVAGGFSAGQIIPANQWTRVSQQFTGSGVASYVMAIAINIPGVGTGIHCKLRKAMLCENPTGKELAYSDGSSTGWIWDGPVDSSTSYGPAIYEAAPIDTLMATAPFYVAHRGSGDVWPEHTATAYNNSLGVGLKSIEVSAQRSSDGWWFCLHDAGASGLDRTTNGTGDPKTFTQAQLNTYIVDIANCGPYWPLQNLKMPDLQTVLTTMLADTKVVVFFETKDYSGSAMDDILAKLQLWFPTKYKTQIIWKSHVSNAAGFTKAKAVGMKCWAYIDYPLDTQQVADAISRADYIGLPRYDNGNGLTDAEIDTAISLIGAMKSISWEPKRRSEIAKLLSKGVDGFVSPPAPYTMIGTANRTQDQFSTGRWAPGDLIRDTTVGAILDSATASMFFNGATTGASVMLGSFCPIGSTSYEINYEMKYDVVPAATLHSGLVFCKADDAKYAFGGASNTTGGYHIVMRQNGQLQLYKHDAGNATGTQVGTTLTTAALDTVNWCKVRVKVTPTSVEIQRMDGTPSSVMNVADTSYRGQYIHLSKNHASTTEFVRFRNVQVTLL